MYYVVLTSAGAEYATLADRGRAMRLAAAIHGTFEARSCLGHVLREYGPS